MALSHDKDEIDEGEDTVHFSDVELDYFVRKMRDKSGEGLEIRNHKRKGKTYSRCFTASEMVQWMASRMHVTPEEALNVSKLLEKRCVIHSVTHKDSFELGATLFKFQEDGEFTELNKSKTWLLAGRDVMTVSKDLLCQIADVWQKTFPSGEVTQQERLGIRLQSRYKDFQTATGELQRVDLANVTHEEKLSFFLNVANTLVLHGMIEAEKLPAKGSEWMAFAGNVYYNIQGVPYSLAQLHFGILRASLVNPKFNFGGTIMKSSKISSTSDPRYHTKLRKPEPYVTYALFTCTESGPPLALYSEATVLTQLELQFKTYLSKHVTVNVQKNTVVLPKLFNWYSRDLMVTTHDAKSILDKLDQVYTTDVRRNPLSKSLDPKKTRISYERFSWEPSFKVQPTAVQTITDYLHTSRQEAAQREKEQQQVILDKKPVFGLPLNELMKKYPNKKVPPFLEQAMRHLLGALSFDDLFLHKGDIGEVETIYKAVNLGKDVSFEKISSPYSVARLLRRFLEELPEPLIPFHLSLPLIDLIKNCYPREKVIHKMRKLVMSLDESARILIELFLKLFLRIAEHKNNGVSTHNLSRLFGTICIKIPGSSAALMLGNTEAINRVFRIMVEECDALFAKHYEKIPVNADAL